MSDLPPGWEWATLGELGHWFGGGTPSKSDSRYWADGTIPWLSPKDMGPDKLTRTKDKISQSALENSTVRPVPHNSVAIVVRSGILERRLPVAVVPFATTLNQDMRAIVPCRGISQSWLAYFLRSAESHILRECSKRGTTVASIDVPSLMRVRVPVAPLEEQHRIVAALEDHFSRLNVARGTLSIVGSRIAKLTASRLYELTHRDMRELVPLRDVAEVRLGRQRSPRNHNGDSMRPYVRAANVGWRGLLLDDIKEMNFTDKEAKIYELMPGDILLNEASGTPSEVGKSALWSSEIEGCCFQNTLIRVRPINVNSKFLLYYLRADAMCGKFISHTRGVNIRHLGAAAASSWPVWVPLLEEQEVIVAEIEKAESCMEAAANATATAVNRERLLRRSLLAGAFAGRLVPPDPKDEPASVLIERIRAERTAQRKPKHARHTKTTDTTHEALL